MTFASDYKDRLREIRREVKRLRRLVEARDRRIEKIRHEQCKLSIEKIRREQHKLNCEINILNTEGRRLGGGFF